MDQIKIVIDETNLAELENRYGTALTQKALRITNTYVAKMQNAAKNMVDEAGHVDTSRLIDSIKSDVKVTNAKVTGQVYSGTKYARFIHEGAKHKGGKIVPHLVPFSVAPSLLVWAKRKHVVYQKRKDGRMRKGSKAGASWYVMSAKGKEYRIDIENDGLFVKQEPVQFFSTPFAKLAPQYFDAIAGILPEE